MQLHRYLTTAVVLVATSTALPAFANPGNGNGNGKGNGAHNGNHQQRGHQQRGHRADRDNDRRYVADCPPGLAKKNPPCVPPGQVRNRDYYPRVGDDFRIGDYIVIRDPGRYDLEDRRGWNYYRDDNHIYRVDSNTRRVLAVLDLIDAFTN